MKPKIRNWDSELFYPIKSNHKEECRRMIISGIAPWAANYARDIYLERDLEQQKREIKSYRNFLQKQGIKL